MGKRLLIVEDDASVSRALSLYLRHKGYLVDCAGDGEDGLAQLRERPYDLVISDVMMPRMNGLDFLHAAKQLRPTLPVIMITGYTDLGTAIEAMKKGAVDFVTKPFRFDVMEQTVASLLGGSTPIESQLHAADLHLRLERKIHELSVLYSISEALETSTNSDEIFRAMTELASRIAEAERSAFFIFDREADQYYLKNAFAEAQGETRPLHFRLDRQIIEDLELHHAPLAWSDGGGIEFYRDAVPAGVKARSLILAPLIVRHESFGVLSVENKKTGAEFTQTDINFISFLLKKASLQIENSALYETIYNNLVNTLRTLVVTLEAKDQYTQRHSDRVTKISLLIAREVGCSQDELDILQFAGMLHDIGKIGISDAILQKKGRLTDEEYEVIKQHPEIGARIMEPMGMLPHEKAIIRHHHERWDGGGYPDHLAGRDIPYLARIVALADSYDAMTSDRVYRKGLSHEVAMQEVTRCAGKQFDPALADAFQAMCARQGENIAALLG